MENGSLASATSHSNDDDTNRERGDLSLAKYIIAHPLDPEAYRRRAMFLFSTNQHERATEDLRKILKIIPDDVIALVNLASAYDISGRRIALCQ
jgi:Flp pilus assembly protein TadD